MAMNIPCPLHGETIMATATARTSRVQSVHGKSNMRKHRSGLVTGGKVAVRATSTIKAANCEAAGLEISCAESFSVQEAKEQFETLLHRAQTAPVAVTRRDKPVAIILSPEEYEHFERLENARWEARLEESTKDERIGHEASEALIQEILNAPDED